MATFPKISASVDSVVMLTCSNWKTELRSNRYHYASRFAKLLPVIFIQPDLEEPTFSYEETEIENLFILYVYKDCSSSLQVELIAEALNQKNIISPLLWIYNPLFIKYIQQAYSPYKIFHATEDYFSPSYPIQLSEDFLKSLTNTLNLVDEIVCVSPGVMDSILNKNIKWRGKSRVIANGCDYTFYSKNLDQVKKENKKEKICFYQGNIYNKLDYELLNQLAIRMPDWLFQYCGLVVKDCRGWRKLLKNKNVKYLGLLSPEKVREYAQQATVGIIPFINAEYLVKRSFPLKAFEYVACGLPVVTTPIDALHNYNDTFLFANNVDEFISQLHVAEKKWLDAEYMQKAAALAKSNSYDNKFTDLIDGINVNIANREQFLPAKLNVLVLYESKSLKINTIKDHLDSYGRFSRHNMFYASATEDNNEVNSLSNFDAVIIHYSLRLSLDHGNWTLSEDVANLLKLYTGLKAAFIQDEYDTTNIAINWLKTLGVQVVFTCVPDQDVRKVYSEKSLPNVCFVNNLTGYVPEDLIGYPVPPIAARKKIIAYRGRSLPYWYGNLGQEKEFIGKKMKEICLKRGIQEDIEWDDKKRIYGKDWYAFLTSAKATLGTESGSNVVDFTGDLYKNINNYLAENPEASYQEVFDLFLREHEGLVKMNQVSPKIFEAICLHTALILFEGEYSGVLEPNKHYIPLKKDFSNIDEVLAKAEDDNFLTQLTDRAYKDIVLSGNYSYQAFINLVDNALSQMLPKGSKNEKIVLVKDKPLSDKKAKLTVSQAIDVLASTTCFNKTKFIVTRKIRIFNPLLRIIKKTIIKLVK